MTTKYTHSTEELKEKTGNGWLALVERIDGLNERADRTNELLERLVEIHEHTLKQNDECMTYARHLYQKSVRLDGQQLREAEMLSRPNATDHNLAPETPEQAAQRKNEEAVASVNVIGRTYGSICLSAYNGGTDCGTNEDWERAANAVAAVVRKESAEKIELFQQRLKDLSEYSQSLFDDLGKARGESLELKHRIAALEKNNAELAEQLDAEKNSANIAQERANHYAKQCLTAIGPVEADRDAWKQRAEKAEAQFRDRKERVEQLKEEREQTQKAHAEQLRDHVKAIKDLQSELTALRGWHVDAAEVERLCRSACEATKEMTWIDNHDGPNHSAIRKAVRAILAALPKPRIEETEENVDLISEAVAGQTRFNNEHIKTAIRKCNTILAETWK